MSINNINKNFENYPIVYYNFNNRNIVKCICLTELYHNNEKYHKCGYYNKYYNGNFTIFNCYKVKIITIYDFNKDITREPIQTSIINKQIKNNEILDNLKNPENYFFKTFLGAVLIYNKFNDMQYIMRSCGYLDTILYNNNIKNIKFDFYWYKRIFLYEEINRSYKFTFCYNHECHVYFNKERIYYIISNNHIKIIKEDYVSNQEIYFNKKKLKIFQTIDETYRNSKKYEETRNNNNEIINYKKYSKRGLIKKFIIDNRNPPYSVPLKKCCIELINHYNENINNIIKIMNFLFKKEKEAKHNLLLYLSLEMINTK